MWSGAATSSAELAQQKLNIRYNYVQRFVLIRELPRLVLDLLSVLGTTYLVGSEGSGTADLCRSIQTIIASRAAGWVHAEIAGT
jgi:hypothetical protein